MTGWIIFVGVTWLLLNLTLVNKPKVTATMLYDDLGLTRLISKIMNSFSGRFPIREKGRTGRGIGEGINAKWPWEKAKDTVSTEVIVQSLPVAATYLAADGPNFLITGSFRWQVCKDHLRTFAEQAEDLPLSLEDDVQKVLRDFVEGRKTDQIVGRTSELRGAVHNFFKEHSDIYGTGSSHPDWDDCQDWRRMYGVKFLDFRCDKVDLDPDTEVARRTQFKTKLELKGASEITSFIEKKTRDLIAAGVPEDQAASMAASAAGITDHKTYNVVGAGNVIKKILGK